MPAQARPAPARFAYVGCRTTRERNARGSGIGVYRLPDSGGPWTLVQSVDGLPNPSFLAFDRERHMLYAVHGDASEVSAFRVAPGDGRLAFVNGVTCRGRNPVHLAVDPSGRFLVVANHITAGAYVSSLAVLPIGAGGTLGEVIDHVPLAGTIGPHRTEQPFAKPHQVVFDPAGRFLAVPDKGLDLVTTFWLDADGRLRAASPPPARAREGAGPRHLAFHPRLPQVFVLNELSSSVMACGYDAETGAIAPRQEVSALPDTYIGFSRASEIEVSRDGRFVYASNRGHDSIATFAVDPDTGRLSPVGWVAAEGTTPRFCALDPSGERLFAANEDSDTIVSFPRNALTGCLSGGTVVARTGSPTCILFA
ncbi:6-phosphogluconolactonase [Methylobacterium crusticola]|uniref:6-phosphogluconolactonase n=1 Tax=Methylobacterium crusticola TaxID=1697972 RepID=A0ABQ4R3D6_9HYPH|nr:lactonase family protein [Methylobacterium crusticola]GJD51791.1 6-phosphogluconolactonase [Methylobacterium crusticola]